MAEMVALRSDQLGVSAAGTAEGFLAATDLAPSTRADYEGTLLMLQIDPAEDPAVNDVMTAALEHPTGRRYPEAAPTTYNRIPATLSSFVHWVCRQGPDGALSGRPRRHKAPRSIEAERQRQPILLPELKTLWSRATSASARWVRRPAVMERCINSGPGAIRDPASRHDPNRRR